jgi:hypothetical protein
MARKYRPPLRRREQRDDEEREHALLRKELQDDLRRTRELESPLWRPEHRPQPERRAE